MDTYDAFYGTLHGWLQEKLPDCLWSGNPERREVALTFDDGPHRQFTPGVLDVLAKRGVLASFFLLGCQIDNTPELAREVVAAGHWIGLHGYYHWPFLDGNHVRQELERTQVALLRATGLTPEQVRDVRPPYGVATPTVLQALKRWGYRVVMWQVLADDSMNPGAGVIAERILRQTRPGALIVLHDGNDGCAGTAQAADRIIGTLQDQGYTFVTVNTWWQPQGK